jgi:hypothetical protein
MFPGDGGGFLREVGEYLMDDVGVVDSGDDLHRALAVGAGLDVDVEYALQALRPGHGGAGFGGGFCFGGAGTLAVAALSLRDVGALMMVRGKDAVIAREVDTGVGHQGGESGDEVERLEKEMGGAITVRRISPPIA